MEIGRTGVWCVRSGLNHTTEVALIRIIFAED